ncbi:SMP-30/gluconolactonase/LRE family protein [Hydrogenophaga sp. 5NK40-0174]|uniref:SMP-30/gluconolactonase/LRE family protein n=1 Tax=Hydrogenophaga sp. 5NK40-0174 TaxID=3127649 RepID=UPI00310913C1
MKTDAELVLDARCSVGESPVWDSLRQALWWVDIASKLLWCWTSTTGQARHWPTPEQTGCIALADGSDDFAHGQWIAAMESGVARLTPKENGTMGCEWITQVEHPSPGMRFNDGRCDRQGRLRAGTMVMDMSLAQPAGSLYALDGRAPSARLQRLQSGFITPNGMAFSPEGTTMYLSDSHPKVQSVWAYDYDIDAGEPSNGRLFVDFNDLPGRPDGAAVDAEGGYWVCGNDAGMVHRFTPDGLLDRWLQVPVQKPAMCAFGGSRMDTLFVTSIRPPGDLSDQPLAGGVFALRPGVPGLEEARCRA